MKNLWNKYTDLMGNTIFHPQFIMLGMTKKGIDLVSKIVKKDMNLVDVGCGRMSYRNKIESRVNSYIGIDYKPTAKLYKSDLRPDLYGDAHSLPLKDQTADIVLMLQSIEYFYNPGLAIKEARRILKKGGVLIITSPFMYPIHDRPFDRFRFTDTQLKYFLEESKYKVEKIEAQGGFFDVVIQSFLVFWFKSATKNPALLLLAPILVPILNLIDLLLRPFQKLFYANSDFPLNYIAVAKKV